VAAVTAGRRPRLAELYIKRAYKLADEEYADIPEIDSEIRSMQEGDESHEGDEN
jgi:hypothetical protein